MELEDFDLIRRLTMMIMVQMMHLTSGMLQPSSLKEISSQDLGVRRTKDKNRYRVP
jgi:hypothetical protein